MLQNKSASNKIQNAFGYIMLLHTLKTHKVPKDTAKFQRLVTPFNSKRNAEKNSHHLLPSSAICPAFLKIFHLQQRKAAQNENKKNYNPSSEKYPKKQILFP